MCAARAGQLLNLNAIARSCGISHSTARGWLSILESSYIIFLLQPYYENFNKRLIKSPKMYFYDTGLLCHLLEIQSPGDLALHPMKGPLFENLIITEFYKNNFHQYLHEEYWFWRDSNAHEVDFLRKSAQLFDIFEIKSTKTITSSLVDGLRYFEKIAGKDRISSKNLIYGGLYRQKRSEFQVYSWRDIH